MTPAASDPRDTRTTIKTRRSTAARLRMLRDGARFPTLDALLDHLARLAAANPQLLKREVAP